MKKLFISLSILMSFVLSSCGGGNVSLDPNMPPHERKAVSSVIGHLEHGESLVDYEVMEGAMPVELMTDEFKRYRDEVNKAGLDYNSCKTRGIDSGMEKAKKKIMDDQEEIQTRISNWKVEQGTSKYIFVLATIKERNGSVKKEIAAFNPVTGQHDFTMPLTKPVVNNAALILNAANSTLFEYATDGNHDTKALVPKDNPILQFIFTDEGVR